MLIAMPTEVEITHLLKTWSDGDPDALDRLMPLVAEELHGMAKACFRHEANVHTLQPTALVSEVYLRLCGEDSLSWNSRKQFFAFAIRLMRNILIDHARRRRAKKRGQGFARVPIDTGMEIALDPDIDLIELDRALDRLEAIDPRQLEIVQLRYFVGLEVTEVAELLGISESTVKREWRAAKYWLYDQLGPGGRTPDRS